MRPDQAPFACKSKLAAGARKLFIFVGLFFLPIFGHTADYDDPAVREIQAISGLMVHQVTAPAVEFELLRNELRSIVSERLQAAKSRGVTELTDDEIYALVRSQWLSIHPTKLGMGALNLVFYDRCREQLARDRSTLQVFSAKIAAMPPAPQVKPDPPQPADGSNAPFPVREAKSTGSGFFVGNQGYFVTNEHVVDDAKSVSIYFDGRLVQASVVNVNRIADLALLKTEEVVAGFGIVEVDAETGTDVYALGFPNPSIQGTDVKVTKGVISGTKGLDNDDTRFQIDAAVQPGNSGGPLCDKSGNLVGVVVSTLNPGALLKATGSLPQNVNYAVKASEVRAFLRSRSVAVAAIGESADNENGGIKAAMAKTGLVVVK